MEYLNTFLDSMIDIVNEMSPYLLLGFFIAGLMHAFIPNGWFTKYLSGKNIRSVLLAALFGIPLPLCSCGVIPTAMSLRREGASKGATTSFLIATPQTGVDSIFATFSLMGLPFAIVRPIAALFTAVFGGALANAFDSDDETAAPADAARNVSEKHLSFGERIVEALKFGFIEMMEDIGKWLVVGLIIAGLITALVPDAWFAVFKDNSVMSMLLVLCISIPMYVCATGSIPIAVALVMKGLTPGAALVLLMAGPAVNAASMLVINKVLGKKSLVLYLIAIISGALLFGFGIDYLLPREWFTATLVEMKACCHETAAWWEWTCSALLIIFLLNVIRMKLMHEDTCSCHDHEHSHEHNHEHSCHCHNHEDNCHDDKDNCHTHDEECHCHDEEHHHKNNDTMQKIFSVKGMNCNHCRASVERAISGIEGVEKVEVDLQSAKAVVTGSNIDCTAIVNAVNALGFEASEL